MGGLSHGGQGFLVLALGVAMTALALPLRAQLSPGPLAQPHAQLEGATHCLDCHQAGKGVTAARCLECHTALARRIAAGEGLHADADYRACATCHVEHHGREFELVWWGDEGRDTFDHRRTGWALEGAHAALTCRSCHRPEHLTVPAATLAAGAADPRTTFLGLSSSCAACHRDEHRGQFQATACADCHTTRQFVPAARFDHAATGFPLTGEHQRVACASCHEERRDPQPEAGDATFLQLVGVEHGNCATCHRDPHAGRLGTTCASCHETAGWANVQQARFDHSRTDFPLTGRHTRVACASCHDRKGERMAFELRHGSCSDCHRDPHAGRLGATCATCHTTAGWGQVDRQGFDHDRTRFELTGAHQRVACASCHPPGRPAVATDFESCASCHRDPHPGALGPSPGTSCESCHTTDAFSPSTFTVAAHDETSFSLTGAHLATPCVACHQAADARQIAGAPRGASGSLVPLHFPSTDCASCHDDPHAGSTERWEGAAGCRSCHDVASWRRIAFDHQRTGFALRGAHVRVACSGCHRDASGSAATAALRFAAAPTDCADCHREPHLGELTRTAPAGCAACHAESEPTTTAFDHFRDTGFDLAGAHAGLACVRCHRPQLRDGERRVPFHSLPTTCEGCHTAATDPTD